MMMVIILDNSMLYVTWKYVSLSGSIKSSSSSSLKPSSRSVAINSSQISAPSRRCRWGDYEFSHKGYWVKLLKCKTSASVLPPTIKLFSLPSPSYLEAQKQIPKVSVRIFIRVDISEAW